LWGSSPTYILIFIAGDVLEVMMEGWILDVYPNYEFDTMTVWLWTRSGARLVVDRFRPSFYVHGPRSELRECARRLADDEAVESISFEMRRLKLESDKRSGVLEITLNSFRRFRDIPLKINRWGRYANFQLFNVDLRLAQKYMFAKGIFPMAHVKVGSTYRVHDEVYSMDYEVPPLRAVDLAVTVGTGKVHGGSGRVRELGYASYDGALSAVHIRNAEDGAWTLESGGDEADLMLELVETIGKIDPDIIYTVNGDEAIFPYLYHRGAENGLGPQFTLDRDTANGMTAGFDEAHSGGDDNTATEGASASGRDRHRPERMGKSYFTYGRIAYKPPFYSLKGRLHIDQRSSFMYSESGLNGLVEISRLGGIPVQTMSRLSPGSAISAIQVSQAMREGVLIKWKKNQPELFKSATELLITDRGGHIFDPCAGVHDNVIELDFVSLYPTIIARKNISPETVLCRCCGDLPDAPRIPGIGYHICTKRRGLIPKVVAPIISRRIAYKRRGGRINDERQKVLKWVLVTCFGYTGYRNARFGRIECHEGITAFARDIMLDAMETAESLGYEVLHGFVDSLWLKPSEAYNEKHRERDAASSAELVCRNISRRIGIPMEFEGHYKWIVFLSNKSFDVGALTRYFGMYSDGSLKVRGIELRQHSTPPLFMRFQSDILGEFKNASNAQELHALLPEVLKIVERYATEILAGRCDARDLVFKARISKTAEEYRVFNNQLAALRQLEDCGVSVHPGEKVSYLILDSSSHDPYRRVKLADRVESEEDYDRRKYMEFLCRTGDSILRPFGYTEEALLEHIRSTTQTLLDRYTG
jgi:DNA polymerase elongation subunit (family B)